MKRIFVPTPKGKKYHGYIEGEVFIRTVKDKDLMKIFDAWSIHPKVLEYLPEVKVKLLRFIHEDGTVYEMDLETAKNKGFEKEFSGGKTIYLQRKYWKVTSSTPKSDEDLAKTGVFG